MNRREFSMPTDMAAIFPRASPVDDHVLTIKMKTSYVQRMRGTEG